MYIYASLNNKDKFCLYNSIFYKVDEFPKIVPSAFGLFIRHHQDLLACVFFFFNGVLKVFESLYYNESMGTQSCISETSLDYLPFK